MQGEGGYGVKESERICDSEVKRERFTIVKIEESKIEKSLFGTAGLHTAQGWWVQTPSQHLRCSRCIVRGDTEASA